MPNKASNKNRQPVEHKDPKDREHLWQRPARHDEQPAVASRDLEEDYHELPRHLHKANGEWVQVDTREECEAALADGWSLLPPKAAPALPAPPADKPAGKPFWPATFGR